MNRRQAIDGINMVKEIFDRNKINVWLDMGTLLGAIREGELVGWDNDVDFAAWYDDIVDFPALTSSFEREDYKVSLYKHKLLVKNEHCDIDIYLHRRVDNNAINFWHRPSISWSRLIWRYPVLIHLIHIIGLKSNNIDSKNFKHPSLSSIIVYLLHLIPYWIRFNTLFALDKITYRYFVLRVPGIFFDNLDEINFYGKSHKIPNNSEEYLSLRYGKDWQIPNKKWSWTLQMNSELASNIIDTNEIFYDLEVLPAYNLIFEQKFN